MEFGQIDLIDLAGSEYTYMNFSSGPVVSSSVSNFSIGCTDVSEGLLMAPDG